MLQPQCAAFLLHPGYYSRKSLFTSDGNSTHALVVYITDDSPAKQAKIQQFDIVIDIDGVSTQDKGTIELLKMLSGQANTESTFTILRGKKVFDVKAKRAERNKQ